MHAPSTDPQDQQSPQLHSGHQGPSSCPPAAGTPAPPRCQQFQEASAPSPTASLGWNALPPVSLPSSPPPPPPGKAAPVGSGVALRHFLVGRGGLQLSLASSPPPFLPQLFPGAPGLTVCLALVPSLAPAVIPAW